MSHDEMTIDDIDDGTLLVSLKAWLETLLT